MTEANMKERMNAIVNQVLRLLEPEDAAKAASKLYVAGGAIVSLTLGEEPHDWDLWCEDQATADIFRSCLGTSVPLTTGADLLSNTENGLTWKLKTGEVVQVVTRFIGPPSRVFESFDYLHAQAYYRPDTGEMSYNRELILSKQLRFNKGKEEYALNTLKRLCKFTSRGWAPDNESIIALYRTIQKSPPIDDPVESKKQKIGFYGGAFT